MIKAKAITQTINDNPPPPPPTSKQVTLVMSGAEAVALRIVLGMVGGNPESTPRGLTANIMEALEEAGVPWFPPAKAPLIYSSVGGIDFKPGKLPATIYGAEWVR